MDSFKYRIITARPDYLCMRRNTCISVHGRSSVAHFNAELTDESDRYCNTLVLQRYALNLTTPQLQEGNGPSNQRHASLSDRYIHSLFQLSTRRLRSRQGANGGIGLETTRLFLGQPTSIFAIFEPLWDFSSFF